MLNTVKRINERFADGKSEPIIAYSEVENTDLASRLPIWKLGDVLVSNTILMNLENDI
jgi:hypothetical protein